MQTKFDLIVVGGGFAGTAAAIAAARLGQDTLLIERDNCLGGAACNALVNPFMPLWTMMPENGRAPRAVQRHFPRSARRAEA